MKVIAKSTKCIVVDDFYENPDYERWQALNATYTKPSKNFRQVKYSYSKVSENSLFSNYQNILDVIGSHFRTELVDSYYGSYYEDDEIESKKNQSWIHFDKFRWIAIAYLNTPQQCRGGTAFYQHKNTEIANFQEFRDLKNSSPFEAEKVMEDSGNVESWRIVDQFDMKFNRLLLIDPRYFHQATCFFGNSLNNCRLTQNFIIKPSN